MKIKLCVAFLVLMLARGSFGNVLTLRIGSSRFQAGLTVGECLAWIEGWHSASKPDSKPLVFDVPSDVRMIRLVGRRELAEEGRSEDKELGALLERIFQCASLKEDYQYKLVAEENTINYIRLVSFAFDIPNNLVRAWDRKQARNIQSVDKLFQERGLALSPQCWWQTPEVTLHSSRGAYISGFGTLDDYTRLKRFFEP
jgi:hypothetical protein